jgi:hypothetical protein
MVSIPAIETALVLTLVGIANCFGFVPGYIAHFPWWLYFVHTPMIAVDFLCMLGSSAQKGGASQIVLYLFAALPASALHERPKKASGGQYKADHALQLTYTRGIVRIKNLRGYRRNCRKRGTVSRLPHSLLP